ncbi:MAG: hypothetical protein WKG01_00020 [Kofleriaceae bacterium]
MPRSILIVWILAAGCSKQLSTQVVQPPLVFGAGVESRTSMPLTIVVRDMETGRLPIHNSAYYVAVSRDRLRFHVVLHHKWDELVDLKRFVAYVEDANGKRHYPEDLSAHVSQVTTVYIRGVLYRINVPLFRGTADLSIYDRDLFAAGGRLTLVLSRPEIEYRYRWITMDVDIDGYTVGQPSVTLAHAGQARSEELQHELVWLVADDASLGEPCCPARCASLQIRSSMTPSPNTVDTDATRPRGQGRHGCVRALASVPTATAPSWA